MTTPTPDSDNTIVNQAGTPREIPVQARYFVQFIDDQSDDWNEGSTWAPNEQMGRKLLEVFKHTIENDPNMEGRLNNAKYRLVRRYVTNAEVVHETP